MTLSNDFKNSVSEAKLHALVSSLTGSVLVGMFIAIFFATYLKDDVPYIGVWLVINFIGGLVRLVLLLKYKKNPEFFSTEKWLKYYHLTTCFVAITWTVVTLMLWNGIPVEKEVIVVAVLIGLITGGVISNIPSKPTAIFYCTSIMCAYIAKTLILKEPYYLEFISAQALYLLLLWKVTKSFNLLYENAHIMSYNLSLKMDVEKELQQEKIKSLQSSKLASLGEMATGIAHEINNPLTVVIGKLQIIKKMLDSGNLNIEKMGSFIDSAIEANRRIAEIVLSMKNLSRIKDKVEQQDFTVSELIKIVQPLYLSKLKNNNVKLISNFDEYSLYADKGEISQALLNLIHNAIDAIKTSSSEKWIELSTEKVDDFVILKVTDSENGIDPNDIDKLFEPFYTTKEIGEGTGLGLSLSKNIMKRNGGDLLFFDESPTTSFGLKIKLAKS